MSQASLRSEAQPDAPATPASGPAEEPGYPKPAPRLVAELLACAKSGSARASEAPVPGGEVVLEVVVEGASYQLVRHNDRPGDLPDVRLSPRELEIARLIANGHTNRTIAVVLDISPWTVSAHVRRVFAKLDVGSRAAMIAKLVTDGFLASPPVGGNRAHT
jgi:DNA-binding CsgD family transcriptional regulator